MLMEVKTKVVSCFSASTWKCADDDIQHWTSDSTVEQFEPGSFQSSSTASLLHPVTDH